MADALFKAVGERMDASEEERVLFAELANQLWTGSFASPPTSTTVPNPRCSKARLENLLQKALHVRRTYQTKAHNVGDISDTDFKRSLTDQETRHVHNAFMSDVAAWMTSDCLQDYQRLIQEAEELDYYGKGSKGSWGKKGNGKSGEGNKSKGWWGKQGKGKGSTGKSATSPRQQAQQLKKQRFNKVVNDIAANKAFFFSLVRHPSLMTADGLVGLMRELTEVKSSKEYQEMLRVSEKKSEEEKELKRKRDQARVKLNRGEQESEEHKDTNLAKLYDSGVLIDEHARAHEQWSRTRQQGVAMFLGLRMGE